MIIHTAKKKDENWLTRWRMPALGLWLRIEGKFSFEEKSSRLTEFLYFIFLRCLCAFSYCRGGELMRRTYLGVFCLIPGGVNLVFARIYLTA